MRKTILILLLALWPALAHAQSPTAVASALKGGPTLPATCHPATSGSKADVFIKTGASAGLKYCDTLNHWADVGGSSGTGDVVGPASATDNAVARFDGTTGKLVQDSAVTIADTTGDITAGKYNKVTLTAPATGSTLTILNGKTLTANNTLTLAGTDGSTLNVGAGGTLGTAAFTAASAYEVPLTFSTGLTRSTNTITVDQSFAPTWTGIHTFTNGVTTGTTTTSGTVHTYNSLTTGTGAYFASSSLSSGNLVNLIETGTAALTGNTVLNISNSGATSTNAQTTYGAIISNTRTNATSGTNVALQLTASGATTSNVALNVTAGQSVFADGAAATPSVKFSGDSTNTGWFRDSGAGNGWVYAVSGTGRSEFVNDDLRLNSSGRIAFTSASSVPSGAIDTFLTRAAAANLRHGAADAASPVAQTISVQNVVAGTSNTAGANFTIAGSRGTGTGTGGSLIFQVAPAGSTGTSQNALATALTIDSTKASTFAGAISGTTANFSGAITVASCTGCGGGTTINASGQGIWIPDVFYDADSFEGVASGNDVKFYRFINPVAVTADRADLKGAVAQASGKFSFSLRSWDCTTTTYFDSGVMDTTSWSYVDVTQTLSSNTLPAGGICLMWTHDNTTSKTRTVSPQANTMAVWNIPASGTKRLGTCSNTSSAGVLPGSCGTETGSNTQGVFQFTLRKN